MIKRRFYKHDHGDRDGPSDSSSNSDSEVGAEASKDAENEDDDDEHLVLGESDKPSTSSGYQSEDSSANDVNIDSSGLPKSDDEMGNGNYTEALRETHLHEDDSKTVDKSNGESSGIPIPSDVPDHVLKSKSVFKCKLCPRIVCLTEDTLRAHLNSKRHARSEKLLNEGRLKLMLNSDGEIEGEAPQERHSLAPAQDSIGSRKKNKGRQRQRKRIKKKTGEDVALDNRKISAQKPAKKRRKTNN